MTSHGERLALGNLLPGTTLSGLACVRRLEPGTTRSGDPYLTVELCNATGRAMARVWKQSMNNWDGIAVGDPVDVTCSVKAGFNGGAPELDVRRVDLMPPHDVQQEINPLCATPLHELERRFEQLLTELSSPLRELLDVVLDTVGRERYWTAPAARYHHHAYIRGLVEHSIEVAELALGMSELPASRDHVDRGAIVLGALLHDVGKVDEYVWERTSIDIAPRGRVAHHTTIGPTLVALAAVQWHERLTRAGLRLSDIHHLQHVQESHHGKPEWGSSVEPASLEALLIHHADMASARLRSMLDDLASAAAGPDGWVTPTGFRKRPVLSLTRRAAPSAPLVVESGPRPEHARECDAPAGTVLVLEVRPRLSDDTRERDG